MRRYILIFTIVLAAVACKTKEPIPSYDSFKATFGSTKSSILNDGQIAWSVGDKVVISNCESPVLFKSGEMVQSPGAECFAVTPSMISPDGLTIQFKPTVASSGRYAILTAREFDGIVGMGTDGRVEIEELKESTELK